MIWEPDDLPLVAPGATTTITARFDTAAYSIAGLQFEAADDGGNSQTANLDGDADLLRAAPTWWWSTRAMCGCGSSAAHLLGVALVGGPEIEERRTSAADGSNQAFFSTRGARTLSVRGNAYVQSRAHAATLAQYLLDRCEYPRLMALASGVPGSRPCGSATV